MAITRVTRAVRGDTQFVELGARIDPGWHVYSLTQDPDGPFPLRVTVPAPTGAASGWTIAGAVKGPAPERQPTSPFGIPVEWYSGAPQFSVPVVATPGKGANTTAVVRVRYQVCSDTLCLPPRPSNSQRGLPHGEHMTHRTKTVLAVAAGLLGVHGTTLAAQAPSALTGRWEGTLHYDSLTVVFPSRGAPPVRHAPCNSRCTMAPIRSRPHRCASCRKAEERQAR